MSTVNFEQLKDCLDLTHEYLIMWVNFEHRDHWVKGQTGTVLFCLTWKYFCSTEFSSKIKVIWRQKSMKRMCIYCKCVCLTQMVNHFIKSIFYFDIFFLTQILARMRVKICRHDKKCMEAASITISILLLYLHSNIDDLPDKDSPRSIPRYFDRHSPPLLDSFLHFRLVVRNTSSTTAQQSHLSYGKLIPRPCRSDQGRGWTFREITRKSLSLSLSMIWIHCTILNSKMRQQMALIHKGTTISELRKVRITRAYSHQAKAQYIKEQGKEVKE